MRAKSEMWHSVLANMKIHFLRLAAVALACGPYLAAQPSDDTILKQVIIFGRHAVRTPMVSNTDLDA